MESFLYLFVEGRGAFGEGYDQDGNLVLGFRLDGLEEFEVAYFANDELALEMATSLGVKGKVLFDESAYVDHQEYVDHLEDLEFALTDRAD